MRSKMFYYRACFVIFWGAQNIIAGEHSLKIPYGTIAVKYDSMYGKLNFQSILTRVKYKSNNKDI